MQQFIRAAFVSGTVAILALATGLGGVTPRGALAVDRPGIPAGAVAPAAILPRDARAQFRIPTTGSGCPPPVPICSPSWAGYVYGMTTPAPMTVTQVSAHWAINFTALQPPPGFTYGKVATWIGIGGALMISSSMIQLGTLGVVQNGATHYSAFYDLQPGAPVTLASMRVLPGDTISALIVSDTVPGACAGTLPCWTLKIVDETQGEVSSIPPQQWATAQASAEWIVSAPYAGSPPNPNNVSPLAQFSSSIFFTNAQVNGQNAGFTNGQTVTLFDPKGQTGNPSAPSATSDGFSVCWGSGTTLTSCSPP